MSKTYEKIEIVGPSPSSFEEAVRDGIQRASQTVKNMHWSEVEASASNDAWCWRRSPSSRTVNEHGR